MSSTTAMPQLQLEPEDPNYGTFRNRIERIITDRVVKPYHRLGKRSKITFWSLVVINTIFLVAFIAIGPRRIGHWFNGLGAGLKEMGWKGMLILSLAVILSSHPPLFGFSGSLTLIGFAWGLWPGFLIAGLASLAGAALAFLSVRMFFLGWMRKISQKNKRWQAFGHVMREKGLPLVAMIRWCPLPWAIGNGLFASIEGVEFWHFMIANALYLPKLIIPVFIGSRLNSITDGEPDTKPDPLKFWLNLGSIAASVAISLATGTWIYRLTLLQMRRHDAIHAGEGELAAEALEHARLLGDFSEDEEEVEELVPHAYGREFSGSAA